MPSGEVHVGYGTEIVSTGFKLDINGSVNSASGGYSIAGTSVLSSSTLGSGVVNSSLTSVGTLTGLTVNGNLGITGQHFVTSNSVIPSTRYRTTATEYLDVGLEIGGSKRAFFYSYANIDMIFWTNGTTRLTINNVGNCTFAKALTISDSLTVNNVSGGLLCAFNNWSSNTAECRWITTGTNGILSVGLDGSDNGYMKTYGSNIMLYCANSWSETMRVETSNVVIASGSGYANSWLINGSREIKKNISEVPDNEIFDNLEFVRYDLKK